MREAAGWRLFRRLTLDMLAWVCIPALFLCVYVRYFSGPLEAALPHLRVAVLIFMTLTLIRVIFLWLIPGKAGPQQAASIVVALALLVMISYYCLVLVGLRSWGQVISLDLIISYAIQLPELSETVGISLAVTTCAIMLIYALLVTVVFIYIKKFDWTAVLVRTLTGWRLAGVFILGVVVNSSEYFNFFMAPATHVAEPLALTLFPHQATHSIQGHVIDTFSAEKVDKVEDAERRTYKPSDAAHRRNLIVIVVDALRPDHLSIYGYTRDTTPYLRSLEEGGLLRKVNNVRAVCGESSCGLLSIATSKFVHQFSRRPFTLQQVLKKHGYRIHMILGGDHTNFYGLKDLYGEVDSYFDGSQARGYFKNDDYLVTDRAKTLASWDGQPVMIQFHLMSAHVLGKRHEKYIRHLPSGSYALPQYHNAANIARAVNYYDNGVIQTDAIIQELLATLKDKKYLENALVVITGDHGEALGEHGLFAHANSVHEEALRIPLIFLSYGYTPNPFNEHRAAASQVDIAPTILAELSMTSPATWTGSTLHKPLNREYSYFQEGNDVGIIDHRDRQNEWKYWTNLKNKEQYAFNLAVDAKEQSNAINTLPPNYLRSLRLQLLQLRSVANGPQ
jgi:glucan phosphoethanolaminetransferase (alkaline phosphatase superfamily)